MTMPHRYFEESIALVMSGGGSKGDFQAGVADVLYHEVFVRPHIVTGTSVGAINGAVLAEGEPDSVELLKRVWRRSP